MAEREVTFDIEIAEGLRKRPKPVAPDWLSGLGRLPNDWADQVSPWTGARWEDGNLDLSTLGAIGRGHTAFRNFIYMKRRTFVSEEVSEEAPPVTIEHLQVAPPPSAEAGVITGGPEITPFIPEREEFTRNVVWLPQRVKLARIPIEGWILIPFAEDFSGNAVGGGGYPYTHTFPPQPSGQLITVFIEAVYSGPSGDANFDFQASTGQTKYLDSLGHGIDRTTTLNPPASLLGPNQQVNQAGQSAWFYVPPDVEFNLAVNVFSVSQSPMDVSGDVSTWRLIHSAPSTFTINGNGIEQNFVTDTDFIGAIYANDSHISVITSDGGNAPTFDWYLANADYATLTTVTDPRDFVNDQKYPATPEVFELSGLVTSSLGTSMWDHAVRVAVNGETHDYSVLVNGTQTIDPANTGGTPDFEADVVTFELKLG